jgi:hypothetical protein
LGSFVCRRRAQKFLQHQPDNILDSFACRLVCAGDSTFDPVAHWFSLPANVMGKDADFAFLPLLPLSMREGYGHHNSRTTIG